MAETNRRQIIFVCKKIIDLFPRSSFEKDPFRVLIATILSQRTKDENTYKASKKLFESFPDVYSLSMAKPSQIYDLIKASGMYRQKAERIIKVSQIIVEKFNGKIPANLHDLLSLPGVGRKTANIVLYHCFCQPALAVDTHVHRISNRLGFVKTKTPEQTEEGLKKIIPKRFWGPINGAMVEFGKKVCLPRKPKCQECPVNKCCEYFNSIKFSENGKN